MEEKVIGLSHDLIIHPGETLSEILLDRNMSQKELATRTGVTEKHISAVMNGQSPISVAFARKHEYVLGIDCSFWVNLQANYDIEYERFKEINEISETEIDIPKKQRKVLKVFNNVLPIDKDLTGAPFVLYLRKLLGISNLTIIPDLALGTTFRMVSTNIDIYILYTWVRLCELVAKKVSPKNSLDVEKLKTEITNIKALMQEEDINTTVEKMARIFASCGIAFEVVKNVEGAPVQGFIKRQESGNLILCLTIRSAFADIFWFSLFHEIAHIVNGDITNSALVDFVSSENEQEKSADIYARNVLLNQHDYEAFVMEHDFKIDSIERFAKLQNVPIWIVIGRLQKEEYIPFNRFTKYKPRYKWKK